MALITASRRAIGFVHFSSYLEFHESIHRSGSPKPEYRQMRPIFGVQTLAKLHPGTYHVHIHHEDNRLQLTR